MTRRTAPFKALTASIAFALALVLVSCDELGFKGTAETLQFGGITSVSRTTNGEMILYWAKAQPSTVEVRYEVSVTTWPSGSADDSGSDASKRTPLDVVAGRDTELLADDEGFGERQPNAATTLVASLDSGELSYTLGLALDASKNFAFNVAAVEASGRKTGVAQWFVVHAISSSTFSYAGCIEATPVANGRIQVSFEYPREAQKVTVYRDGQPTFVSVASDTTSFIDEGLVEGLTYVYNCEALVANGAVAGQTVLKATVKDSLDALSDYVGCLSVKAIGPNDVQGELAFPLGADLVTVYRAGLAVYTAKSERDVRFVDSGLREGDTYEYTCEARLPNGKTKVGSQRLSIRTLASHPPTFAGVTDVTVVDPRSVRLGWGVATGVRTEYFRVFGMAGATLTGGDFNDANELARVAGTELSVVVTTLGDELPYSFGVRACTIDDVCDGNTATLGVTMPDGGAPRTVGATALQLVDGAAVLTAPWMPTLGAVSKRRVYVRTGAVGGNDLGNYTVAKTIIVTDQINVPTSLSVNGLAEFQTYWFLVQDEDPTGNRSTPSTPVTLATGDLTKPASPGLLSLSTGAAGDEETSATITFSPIPTEAADMISGGSKYLVFGTFDGSDPCSKTTPLKTYDNTGYTVGVSANYVVRGLKARTSYRICLKARDAAGNVSSTSNSLTYTTLDTTPPAYDGLQSVIWNAAQSRFELTWNESTSPDVKSYRIRIWKGSVPPAPEDVTLDFESASNRLGVNLSNVDFPLTDNTTYYFIVDACDDAALLPGGTQNCTAATAASAKSLYLPDVTPPASFMGVAPAGSLTTPAEGQINVVWTAPGSWSDYRGFYVYDVKPDNSLLFLKDCPCASTDCSDHRTSCLLTALDARRTYKLHVRAYDTTGNVTTYLSPASSSAQKMTVDATPPTFSSALALATSGAGISASWNAAADNQYTAEPGAVISYLLYRKTGSTFATPTVPSGDGTLVTTLSTRTFVDTSVTSNTTNYYTVCARDAQGNRTCDGYVRSLFVADVVPPTLSQPTSVKALSDQIFDIAWSMSDDSTATASIYVEVRRKLALTATDFPLTTDGVYLTGNGLTSMSSETCTTAGRYYNFLVSVTDLAGLTTSKSVSVYCDKVHWTNVAAPTPINRRFHTSTVAASKIVIWGGLHQSEPINSGGTYDIAADAWTETTRTGAPAPRSRHSAVWTGSEVIVWGGSSSAATALGNGGRFNPTTNTWTAVATTGAPAVYNHASAFIGTEMIIWGGHTGSLAASANGFAYDIGTNTWSAIAASPLTARELSAATTVDGKMYVWGGCTWGGGVCTPQNDGAYYDPFNDSWTPMTAPPTSLARASIASAVIGTRIYYWGGASNHNGCK